MEKEAYRTRKTSKLGDVHLVKQNALHAYVEIGRLHLPLKYVGHRVIIMPFIPLDGVEKLLGENKVDELIKSVDNLKKDTREKTNHLSAKVGGLQREYKEDRKYVDSLEREPFEEDPEEAKEVEELLKKT